MAFHTHNALLEYEKVAAHCDHNSGKHGWILIVYILHIWKQEWMPSANVVKGGSKKSKLLILAVNEINAKINSLLFWATLYIEI